ncbi:MAG: cytochrome C [Gammaproteobacteria bacterium]|jgi:mono/diheme cytochrome c family protein|nr:cytochrome C [Gammaproteobacteria bacterium]
MNRLSILTLLLALVVGLTGCDQERTMSERGFRLPDGNAMAGRETFLYMHCNQCHTIEGEELEAIAGFEPFVELGGPVTRVKTYGELVTAIINPSHKLADGYPEDLVSVDGKSKMYVYNGFMTVQELTDIVMFLQPHYEVIPPEFQYRVYP